MDRVKNIPGRRPSVPTMIAVLSIIITLFLLKYYHALRQVVPCHSGGYYTDPYKALSEKVTHAEDGQLSLVIMRRRDVLRIFFGV